MLIMSSWLPTWVPQREKYIQTWIPIDFILRQSLHKDPMCSDRAVDQLNPSWFPWPLAVFCRTNALKSVFRAEHCWARWEDPAPNYFCHKWHKIKMKRLERGKFQFPFHKRKNRSRGQKKSRLMINGQRISCKALLILSFSHLLAEFSRALIQRKKKWKVCNSFHFYCFLVSSSQQEHMKERKKVIYYQI